MTPTAEFKLVPLRETAAPHTRPHGDTPEAIIKYWRAQVETSPNYCHTTEQAVVFFLNTRRRITGHVMAATGTLDTILIHPREIYHAAILANAAAIVMAHNHPSGDPTPSEADIKVTRDLIRAGQLLKIEMLDSIVIGHHAATQPFVSLRAAGYFFS
jgi:DNA repair protein RadC